MYVSFTEEHAIHHLTTMTLMTRQTRHFHSDTEHTYSGTEHTCSETEPIRLVFNH